jgi:hypothetical protein
LTEAANRDEAWAANKLGRCYLEGISINVPGKKNPVIIDFIIDYDKAFKYFQIAHLSYHMFYDVYCCWACANLYVYFLSRLNEYELYDMYDIFKHYHDEEEIMTFAFGQKELPSKEEYMKPWRKAL